ncbi:acyl-homoserine-lactone synthase [Montanilutibacter psychrotolerans]|uniref:Acyl-homoserine-lactone synthase n=1 Tax=Montanilutibacter psychrotolerans TaxID=1327343 RepID=A0A3M8SYN8_9GAMM|nr:acyl-homoserine-lactone synthase [Lysobacter psychrotolerans]RNF84374.1 GNAT family N-acetyltransferase [Lysobacter psychrotolerans]
MTQITIARAGEAALHAPLLDSMYRLRTDVFHHRLGWEVRVENGREHDWFDLIGPYYVVAHEASSSEPHAVGCCRLLPTQGPNMLRDIFPFLADGSAVPVGPRIWEISRFAVAEDHTRGLYGFSDLPTTMMAEVMRFAASRGIEAIVGVTSAPFERMLLKLGLQLHRLGEPRRIGNVKSLAFYLPVSDQNLLALGVEPVHATLAEAA